MRRSFGGELAYDGAIFQTTIDSEVIAYHIAQRALYRWEPLGEPVANAMKKIKGAYSLVIMQPEKAHRCPRSAGIQAALYRKA